MSTGISAGEHNKHVILVNPHTVTLHARDGSSEKNSFAACTDQPVHTLCLGSFFKLLIADAANMV